MFIKCLFSVVVLVFCVQTSLAQIIQFGECVTFETMKFFSIDNFLGKWYEIQRFPTWYELQGRCPYKLIEACGRHIQVEHSFIRDGVQFVLRVNSTYVPGDDAILNFQENNIDSVGIPMTVIATDYTNYALVYGCKYKEDLDLKFITAWILSREPSLSPDLLQKARDELNSIPFASLTYLETVDQNEGNCSFYWTAHVKATNFNDNDDKNR